ncbi:MAG: hypothetical protein NTY68_03105 [Candidatus Micrarchaeota archaeon]|nr:hypothetical protein [Candidatus Micrarchaeota archaeon]
MGTEAVKEIGEKQKNQQNPIDNYLKSILGLEYKHMGSVLDSPLNSKGDYSTRWHEIAKYSGIINDKKSTLCVVLPNKSDPMTYVLLGKNAEDAYNTTRFDLGKADLRISEKESNAHALNLMFEGKGVQIPEFIQPKPAEKRISIEKYIEDDLGLKEKHRGLVSDSRSMINEDHEHDITKYSGMVNGKETTVCIISPNGFDPTTYILFGKKAENAYYTTFFDKEDKSILEIFDTKGYPSQLSDLFRENGIQIPEKGAESAQMKRKPIDIGGYMKDRGFTLGPTKNGIIMYYKKAAKDEILTVGIKSSEDDRYVNIFLGGKADAIYEGRDVNNADMMVFNNKREIPALDSFLKKQESGEILEKRGIGEGLGELAQSTQGKQRQKNIPFSRYLGNNAYGTEIAKVKYSDGLVVREVDMNIYKFKDSGNRTVRIGVVTPFGEKGVSFAFFNKKIDDILDNDKLINEVPKDMEIDGFDSKPSAIDLALADRGIRIGTFETQIASGKIPKPMGRKAAPEKVAVKRENDENSKN